MIVFISLIYREKYVLKGFIASCLLLIYAFLGKKLRPYISQKLNNLVFSSAVILSLTVLATTTSKEYQISYKDNKDQNIIQFILFIISFLANGYFLLKVFYVIKDDVFFTVRKIFLHFNFFGLGRNNYFRKYIEKIS